jgi:hypothetical protein
MTAKKNTVLASWMDKNGSEFKTYEEFAANFNEACAIFRDNSNDDASYNTIADAYLGYDKFYADALNCVKGLVFDEKTAAIADATADAVTDGKTAEEIEEIAKQKEEELTKVNNPLLHDKEWCIAKYKNDYFTKGFVWTELITQNGVKKEVWSKTNDWTKISVTATGTQKYTFAGLYEDVYKLRWDYNSKK